MNSSASVALHRKNVNFTITFSLHVPNHRVYESIGFMFSVKITVYGLTVKLEECSELNTEEMMKCVIATSEKCCYRCMDEQLKSVHINHLISSHLISPEEK